MIAAPSVSACVRCFLLSLLLFLLSYVALENSTPLSLFLNPFDATEHMTCACHLCGTGPNLTDTLSIRIRIDGQGAAALHLLFGAAVAHRLGMRFAAVGPARHTVHGVDQDTFFSFLFSSAWEEGRLDAAVVRMRGGLEECPRALRTLPNLDSRPPTRHGSRPVLSCWFKPA